MEARTQKQSAGSRHTSAIDDPSASQNVAEGLPAAQVWDSIYAALYAAYGPQHWWPAETRFEMIVGAYLTQATSWRSVERSLNNLRAAGLLSIAGIRRTPEEELQAWIRPSGFVQRKAASLHAFVRFLDRQYRGSLNQLRQQHPTIAREQLLSLPGVGPETADAILLYALDHPAIVVDEYLRRVSRRHGLSSGLSSGKLFDEKLRDMAARMLRQRRLHSTEREDAGEFHALIVEVGKRHCRATAQCAGCPLEKFLPSTRSGAEVYDKF